MHTFPVAQAHLSVFPSSHAFKPRCQANENSANPDEFCRNSFASMKQEAHFSVPSLRMFSQALTSVSASAEAPHLQNVSKPYLPTAYPGKFSSQSFIIFISSCSQLITKPSSQGFIWSSISDQSWFCVSRQFSLKPFITPAAFMSKGTNQLAAVSTIFQYYQIQKL